MRAEDWEFIRQAKQERFDSVLSDSFWLQMQRGWRIWCCLPEPAGGPWIAELVDEDDLEGPVRLVDPSGAVGYVMSQRAFRCFRNYPPTAPPPCGSERG